MRPIQQPIRTPNTGALGGHTVKHPAFAAISAYRVRGQFNLFGSNIGHNGAVKIELTEATLNDDPHHESIHGSGRTIAEVYLSEAQWVAFISRMNMGSGTPCTLTAVRGEGMVPGLPPTKSPTERLRCRAQDMLDASQKQQDEAAAALRGLIDDLKVSAKTKDELHRQLRFVLDHGQTNRDYQTKVLAETNEKLVTEAKIELDAAVSSIVTRLGISSLQQLAQIAGDAPAQLEDGRD